MALFLQLPEDLQREIGKFLTFYDFHKIPSLSCLHKEDDIFWKMRVARLLEEKASYKNIYDHIAFVELFGHGFRWEDVNLDYLTENDYFKRFINKTDRSGDTALSHYIQNVEIVQQLIASGADVNIPDIYGKSPLMLLSSINFIDKKIKLLLENGADVNYQDYDGNTALHREALYQHPNLEIFKILLDAGASLTIKNKNGLTPYDVGKSNSLYHDKIIAIMNKYIS